MRQWLLLSARGELNTQIERSPGRQPRRKHFRPEHCALNTLVQVPNSRGIAEPVFESGPANLSALIDSAAEARAAAGSKTSAASLPLATCLLTRAFTAVALLLVSAGLPLSRY